MEQETEALGEVMSLRWYRSILFRLSRHEPSLVARVRSSLLPLTLLPVLTILRQVPDGPGPLRGLRAKPAAARPASPAPSHCPCFGAAARALGRLPPPAGKCLFLQM